MFAGTKSKWVLILIGLILLTAALTPAITVFAAPSDWDARFTSPNTIVFDPGQDGINTTTFTKNGDVFVQTSSIDPSGCADEIRNVGSGGGEDFVTGILVLRFTQASEDSPPAGGCVDVTDPAPTTINIGEIGVGGFETAEECTARGGEWLLDPQPPHCSIGPGGITPEQAECEAAGGSWNGSSNTCTPLAATPTCESQGGPLAWIACQVVELMLGAISGMTSLMNDLLKVRPIVVDDPDTEPDPEVIYVVWRNVRNVALSFLALSMLYMVFIQAVKPDVDAYLIKRVIPRISIAAIGIMLSFFMSAILIDLFNVLGEGIQSFMFNAVEGFDIITTTGSGSAAALLLGALGTATVIAIINPAWIASVGLILLPIVMAFIMAIAVVILRQVVIIALVILAPLAIAAWILPNTDQYFKKWLNTFTNMLMMFPIIMTLLGAGTIYAVIITNGGGLNASDGVNESNFINYLLALAGLGITMAAIPFTLRAASGILKQVAGSINNPNRGPIDRLKKGMQGVKDRNLEERKKDRVHAIKTGFDEKGRKLSGFRKGVYRASTGLLTRQMGGGKYAEDFEKAATAASQSRVERLKRLERAEESKDYEGAGTDLQETMPHFQRKFKETGLHPAAQMRDEILSGKVTEFDEQGKETGKTHEMSFSEFRVRYEQMLRHKDPEIEQVFTGIARSGDEGKQKDLITIAGLGQNFGALDSFAPHLSRNMNEILKGEAYAPSASAVTQFSPEQMVSLKPYAIAYAVDYYSKVIRGEVKGKESEDEKSKAREKLNQIIGDVATVAQSRPDLVNSEVRKIISTVVSTNEADKHTVWGSQVLDTNPIAKTETVVNPSGPASGGNLIRTFHADNNVTSQLNQNVVDAARQVLNVQASTTTSTPQIIFPSAGTTGGVTSADLAPAPGSPEVQQWQPSQQVNVGPTIVRNTNQINVQPATSVKFDVHQQLLNQADQVIRSRFGNTVDLESNLLDEYKRLARARNIEPYDSTGDIDAARTAAQQDNQQT